MFRLAGITEPSVYVVLDLAAHLNDERTLRLLRNLISHSKEAKNPLVLIDHRSDLPRIVEEYTTRFELSLPDEDELEQLARETLRRVDEARLSGFRFSWREASTPGKPPCRSCRGLGKAS